MVPGEIALTRIGASSTARERVAAQLLGYTDPIGLAAMAVHERHVAGHQREERINSSAPIVSGLRRSQASSASENTLAAIDHRHEDQQQGRSHPTTRRPRGTGGPAILSDVSGDCYRTRMRHGSTPAVRAGSPIR